MKFFFTIRSLSLAAFHLLLISCVILFSGCSHTHSKTINELPEGIKPPEDLLTVNAYDQSAYAALPHNGDGSFI